MKKRRENGQHLEMDTALPLSFLWRECRHITNKHGCGWVALCLLNPACEGVRAGEVLKERSGALMVKVENADMFIHMGLGP